jgi:hypothetical protein
VERRAESSADDDGCEMSAQYFIATTVNDRQYVVVLIDKIVAGPYNTAAEAVKARDALLAKRPT